MPAGVASLLSAARDELARLSPRDANDEMRSGAILVDIRSERQIAIDGGDPGRGPRAAQRPRVAARPGVRASRPGARAARRARVVLICDEGYQSSLAAATLTRFGLDATDVVGGFQAWRAAGLAVSAS